MPKRTTILVAALSAFVTVVASALAATYSGSATAVWTPQQARGNLFIHPASTIILTINQPGSSWKILSSGVWYGDDTTNGMGYQHQFGYRGTASLTNTQTGKTICTHGSLQAGGDAGIYSYATFRFPNCPIFSSWQYATILGVYNGTSTVTLERTP